MDAEVACGSPRALLIRSSLSWALRNCLHLAEAACSREWLGSVLSSRAPTNDSKLVESQPRCFPTPLIVGGALTDTHVSHFSDRAIRAQSASCSG